MKYILGKNITEGRELSIEEVIIFAVVGATEDMDITDVDQEEIAIDVINAVTQWILNRAWSQ